MFGEPVRDRIMAKVIEDHHGCWLFGGGRNKYDYGVVKMPGERRSGLAHRLMYESDRGPIPPGMETDHLCRVRACVNPWHLEIVTRHENILRGISPWAKNARKTHCKHGHEFTPENTLRTTNGGRSCRICKNTYALRHYYDLRRRLLNPPPGPLTE